jgi:hypothetical protein
MAGVTGCCILFYVSLYEDWGRSLPLQSGGKVQSDSDHKEQWTLQKDSEHKEHRRLQSYIDHKEKWTLCSDIDHKENWTLHSNSDQLVTQQAMLSVCVLNVSVLWTAELTDRMPSIVHLYNTGVLQVQARCPNSSKLISLQVLDEVTPLDHT